MFGKVAIKVLTKIYKTANYHELFSHLCRIVFVPVSFSRFLQSILVFPEILWHFKVQCRYFCQFNSILTLKTRLFPKELWTSLLSGFESSMNRSTAPRPKIKKFWKFMIPSNYFGHQFIVLSIIKSKAFIKYLAILWTMIVVWGLN